MSGALTVLAFLSFALLAYLVGHHRGRRKGRLGMARMVEQRYGPLLEQLERFVDSTESFAADLSESSRRLIDEHVGALRKASRWN